MNVFPVVFLILPAIAALAVVLIMFDTVFFPEKRRAEAETPLITRSIPKRLLNYAGRALGLLLFVLSAGFLLLVLLMFVGHL